MIDIPEAVLFYLRHQAQIDEWATLADKVPAVAHEFYLGLGPKLEAAAMGRAGAPAVEASTTGDDHCGFRLVLPGWRQPDGFWRAGIAIEWRRGKATFTNLAVGVAVMANHPDGESLYRQVRSRIAPLADSHGFKSSPRWWPAWRIVTPSRPTFWEDLDRFADELVDTMFDCLALFETAVTEVLEADPNG
ncbi:MAG: hypothetical protein KC549_16915 [Myxococcales bacterium]|nr:hypothetical protein [Myxococcales bacterium]MCB9546709.1 hypothetical protein [Myxococcales bacterium]